VGSSLKAIATPAAEFYSYGAFTDTLTKFVLHGDFSDSSEPAVSGNRVMANVYIDLDNTTTYYKSELGFKCIGLQKPYGTPDDPRLRFVCTGRFDPAGPGDLSYRAVLEVNQHGKVNCVEFQLTNGSCYVDIRPGAGFKVSLESTMFLLDPRYRTADPAEAARIKQWREDAAKQAQ
jgi:hypothetical protein